MLDIEFNTEAENFMDGIIGHWSFLYDLTPNKATEGVLGDKCWV